MGLLFGLEFGVWGCLDYEWVGLVDCFAMLKFQESTIEGLAVRGPAEWCWDGN